MWGGGGGKDLSVVSVRLAQKAQAVLNCTITFNLPIYHFFQCLAADLKKMLTSVQIFLGRLLAVLKWIMCCCCCYGNVEIPPADEESTDSRIEQPAVQYPIQESQVPADYALKACYALPRLLVDYTIPRESTCGPLIIEAEDCSERISEQATNQEEDNILKGIFVFFY